MGIDGSDGHDQPVRDLGVGHPVGNQHGDVDLAVGEAVGRGGSFADDFELTRSRALGSEVVLDFEPRSESGFVLSALYDGPVLFATC